MVHLRAEHPMKYLEIDYNEILEECPAGMSISQPQISRILGLSVAIAIELQTASATALKVNPVIRGRF